MVSKDASSVERGVRVWYINHTFHVLACYIWSLQEIRGLYKSPDTDLGTRGKLLKKSLFSSLLCFFQSKDLMDAIATNLIMWKRQTENLKFTHVAGNQSVRRHGHSGPPSQLKKRKVKKHGRAVSESPSITRLKGIGTVLYYQGTLLFDDHYHTGHQKWTPHPHCPQLLVPSGKVNSYPALESINNKTIRSLLTGSGGLREFARVSSIDNYGWYVDVYSSIWDCTYTISRLWHKITRTWRRIQAACTQCVHAHLFSYCKAIPS